MITGTSVSFLSCECLPEVSTHWKRPHGPHTEAAGNLPNRRAKTSAENGVGKDGDDHESRGEWNVEHGWIRCEEHAQFQGEREQNRPAPMPLRSITNQGQLHITPKVAPLLK